MASTVVVFTGTSNTGTQDEALSFLLPGGSAIEYLTSNFADKVKVRAIVRKPGGGDIFSGLPVEVDSFILHSLKFEDCQRGHHQDSHSWAVLQGRLGCILLHP
jgi:hypothetical protein